MVLNTWSGVDYTVTSVSERRPQLCALGVRSIVCWTESIYEAVTDERTLIDMWMLLPQWHAHGLDDT